MCPLPKSKFPEDYNDFRIAFDTLDIQSLGFGHPWVFQHEKCFLPSSCWSYAIPHNLQIQMRSHNFTHSHMLHICIFATLQNGKSYSIHSNNVALMCIYPLNSHVYIRLLIHYTLTHNVEIVLNPKTFIICGRHKSWQICTQHVVTSGDGNYERRSVILKCRRRQKNTSNAVKDILIRYSYFHHWLITS